MFHCATNLSLRTVGVKLSVLGIAGRRTLKSLVSGMRLSGDKADIGFPERDRPGYLDLVRLLLTIYLEYFISSHNFDKYLVANCDPTFVFRVQSITES